MKALTSCDACPRSVSASNRNSRRRADEVRHARPIVRPGDGLPIGAVPTGPRDWTSAAAAASDAGVAALLALAVAALKSKDLTPFERDLAVGDVAGGSGDLADAHAAGRSAEAVVVGVAVVRGLGDELRVGRAAVVVRGHTARDGRARAVAVTVGVGVEQGGVVAVGAVGHEAGGSRGLADRGGRASGAEAVVIGIREVGHGVDERRVRDAVVARDRDESDGSRRLADRGGVGGIAGAVLVDVAVVGHRAHERRVVHAEVVRVRRVARGSSRLAEHLVDRGIARAERHATPDGAWSRWTHAFVFGERRSDGPLWIIESDMQVLRGHVQFGVQENRTTKYHDEKLYSSLAVLDFQLPPESVNRVVAEGLELVSGRTRYSLREILGTSLRRGKRAGGSQRHLPGGPPRRRIGK